MENMTGNDPERAPVAVQSPPAPTGKSSEGTDPNRVDEVGGGSRFDAKSVGQTILKGWSLIFLAALIVVFSITGSGFLTLFNIQTMLADAAILAILALGQTFVILGAGIDLSAGYVMGLASVASALVLNHLAPGSSIILIILVGGGVAVAVGATAGILNGAVTEALKVPPFIVTLGMYGVAQGVGYLLSGGQPVSVHQTAISPLGNGYIAYWFHKTGLTVFHSPAGVTGLELRDVTGIIPNLLVLLVVLFGVCWWVMAKTRFGQHLYALGGNRTAARRAGVSVTRVSLSTFIICSTLAGVAGFVYVLRYSSGTENSGDALLLQAIAAVVIGGTSLFGGVGKITGTAVGVLIITVIQNGLVIVGIDPYWQYIAVGLVIVLAVVVDRLGKKAV
jgi:ribose/xylose/arabinose/galactoside ABC-type transport system permease subunit